MKKDKGKGAKSVSHFVELSSIEDLARNVSTFGEGVRPLFAFKEKEWLRIFSLGIKLGGTRLVFFSDSKKSGSCLVYQPKTITNVEERAEVKDEMVISQNRDLQNIPIIELVRNPFEKRDGKRMKVVSVGVRDYNSVVKGVITRSLEDGGIGKVYAFKYKSVSYIGSFGLMDDTKMFCYAKAGEKVSSFFRYNYTTDKVEVTDVFGEHSYLYVRVIKLKEPFLFFKPE